MEEVREGRERTPLECMDACVLIPLAPRRLANPANPATPGPSRQACLAVGPDMGGSGPRWSYSLLKRRGEGTGGCEKKKKEREAGEV